MKRYRFSCLYDQEIRLMQLARKRRVAFQLLCGRDRLTHRGDDKAGTGKRVDNIGKGAVILYYAVNKPADRPFAADRILGKIVIQNLSRFVARPDLVGRRGSGQRVFLRKDEEAARRQQRKYVGAQL